MPDQEDDGVENGVNKLDMGVDYENIDLTPENISTFLIHYVDILRPGLKRFYPEPKQSLSIDTEPIKRAEVFANRMRKLCGREAAMELTLLTLYDLVVLVDNSLSMKLEQRGERIKTLTRTMELVTKVYSGAAHPEKPGITAVKSLNTEHDHNMVTPRKIKSYLKKLTFEGTTPIGTVLDQKILKEFVVMKDDSEMKKQKRPLLVIIITDGEIEGEPKDRLKRVIKRTAAMLSAAHPPHGAQAVSYQFAKIGDDSKATGLVQGLDNDSELYPFIDCLLQSKLEDLSDDTKMWHVIPKLFLGAIYRRFDKEKSGADGPGFQDVPDTDLDIMAEEESGDLEEDEDDGLLPGENAAVNGNRGQT